MGGPGHAVARCWSPKLICSLIVLLCWLTKGPEWNGAEWWALNRHTYCSRCKIALPWLLWASYLASIFSRRKNCFQIGQLAGTGWRLVRQPLIISDGDSVFNCQYWYQLTFFACLSAFYPLSSPTVAHESGACRKHTARQLTECDSKWVNGEQVHHVISRTVQDADITYETNIRGLSLNSSYLALDEPSSVVKTKRKQIKQHEVNIPSICTESVAYNMNIFHMLFSQIDRCVSQAMWKEH
jgi:hypothetical protein